MKSNKKAWQKTRNAFDVHMLKNSNIYRGQQRRKIIIIINIIIIVNGPGSCKNKHESGQKTATTAKNKIIATKTKK